MKWSQRRRLFFRLQPQPVVITYPGVIFRLSTPSGVVVQATSEHLYYSAKYAGTSHCNPSCLADCDKHGWLNLISGGFDGWAEEFTTVPVKIEIKPTQIEPESQLNLTPAAQSLIDEIYADE
jgi:hypothetical protein